MKKMCLLAALVLSASFSRPARADAVGNWFKSAATYLKTGQVAPGKVPALFCTVSLVSPAPLKVLGSGKPDRSMLMYAHGEVTQYPFPVSISFEGKLPLWINSGDTKNPFNGGQNNTLNVVLKDAGGQSFNWQIDGRNRMGKGPQPFALNAQIAQMTPDFLLYTGSLNFHGMKDITLTLIRGEKDAPKQAKNPVGARYRVTPSFVVTNSNDGVGDSTVEIWGRVDFAASGKGYSGLDLSGEKRGKGGRIGGKPFEVETRFDNIESNRLRLSGNLYDADLFNNTDDEMWRHKMSIPLRFHADSKDKTAKIPPQRAYEDDEAQGTLEIKVEKIADVF